MEQKGYQQVKAFCDEYRLVEPEDGVLIGLSGGADSIYLLHFLNVIQREYGLRLYAVHIHHGIRGEEADADEAFARACAAQLEIPFESVHGDVPLLAREDGVTIEEAGRRYRYQCFREIAARRGLDKIAVAHHQNDQAETVLFQLIRGSGLRGLGGMRPCSNGVIRPLLVLTRGQIEQELSEQGIAWRTDSTNRDRSYARNKLRQEVIPYLQKEIQPETVRHLAETAGQMQEVWDYMDRQVQQAAEGLVSRESGRIRFARSAFLRIDAVLQPYILLKLMAELAQSRRDLGKVHVQNLLKLIQGETGKRISLPYGMTAGRDYDEIWLARPSEETAACDLHQMTPAAVSDFPWILQMHRRARWKLPREIPKNDCTKWFDYAKMEFDSVWRHPMPGDTMVIDRDGHQKKLSRILLDEKVPREQRGRLWVLAVGECILWVPQINRASMGFYVTEETKEVLVVNIAEKGGTHVERDHSRDVFGGTGASQNSGIGGTN